MCFPCGAAAVCCSAVTRKPRGSAELRLPAVGILCEIMNDNGTMARLPELRQFARKHCSSVPIDLIHFRRTREKLWNDRNCQDADDYGEFDCILRQS